LSIISGGGAVVGADAGPAGPTIDPRDYFNTIVWAGDSASPRTLTGVGFQPDLVWGKVRDYTYDPLLYDAVRGAGITKALGSSSTAAEGSMGDNATNGYISAFTSDGFSVVGSGDPSYWNSSGEDYVAWNWKANGAGSSNTDGSITSTVSASTDSGFSIVKATIPASGSSDTIGHGLGVAPSMVIAKPLTGSTNWWIFHTGLTSAAYRINLESPNQEALATGVWNSTAPSDSVVAIGASWYGAGSAVLYCFTEISGFSKIGSYIGNGSPTGPTITTDFQPSWLMIKRRNDTSNWIIHDSARDATNPRTAYLEPNTSAIEQSGLDVDFNATGFQIKSSSATVNADTEIYIYMCIA
jgi:hypothetical protein